ncbi:MAG: hypothetical protein ACRCVX_16475, partial [Shewanella sp.]
MFQQTNPVTQDTTRYDAGQHTRQVKSDAIVEFWSAVFHDALRIEMTQEAAFHIAYAASKISDGEITDIIYGAAQTNAARSLID